MRIEYNHFLTAEETYNKIQELLPAMTKKYSELIDDYKIEWNEAKNKAEFYIKVEGLKTQGTIQLAHGQLTLEGKVPLLLRPFQGKIEKMIRIGIDDLLKESTTAKP